MDWLAFILLGWRMFGKRMGGRTGFGRLSVKGYSSGLSEIRCY
jgi:hypothetical protein